MLPNRIGLSGTNLIFHAANGKASASRKFAVTTHKSTANFQVDWLEKQAGFESVRARKNRREA
jgi:hypothetical protein